jgi:hypothetical protein
MAPSDRPCKRGYRIGASIAPHAADRRIIRHMSRETDTAFRIAVLDQPAETWARPGTAALFTELVSLKLAGYWNAYTASVLPVDGSDFYSTHFLVSHGGEDEPFRAVMGFRFTTLARCRQYNAPFPALALAQAAGAQEHAQAMRVLIDRCDRENRTMAYAGSWTIAPDLTSGRIALRDLTTAGMYLLHEAFGIDDGIVGGTLRFKTDRLFQSWGFGAIANDEGPLPPVRVAHLGDEIVLLMHSSGFTDTARQVADRWRKQWDNRLAIGPVGSPVLPLA